MMDDYFDRCSRDEMHQITNRIIELLNGNDPQEPAENGIFHLYWVLRQDAIACKIPTHLYNRFVKSIREVFMGYSDEKVYYRKNEIPPLPVYLLIREATSGVQPYTLCSLMIGIHNDIISLHKELHRDGDTMNIVKVLQQENKLSCTMLI